MATAQNQVVAVLTGDLVGSRNLTADQIRGTFEGMQSFWAQFSAVHAGGVVGGVEIFRGDGWQAALSAPELALHAALFLRAAVKACPYSAHADTRIGIGIGEVTQLYPDRLGESQGLAFEASGDALEKLSSSKVKWSLSAETFPQLKGWEAVLIALDMAVSKWSAAESIAVLGELLGWTQEETSQHAWAQKEDGTAPTPQAVSKALNRILWKSHHCKVLKRVQSDLSSTL